MPVEENDFFRQITMRICGSLNIETALSRCLDYLGGRMPVTGIVLGMYNPEQNLLCKVASVGMDDVIEPADFVPMPEDLWGRLKERWAEEAGITLINDADREEPYIRRVISLIWKGDLSYIFMDLELDDRRLGVVSFTANGKNRFTERDVRAIALVHEPFAIAMANILQHREVLRLKDMLADDNRYLLQELYQISGDKIIGADFGLRGVMEMVRQVATLDSSVLLLGETGVGKEVIAGALHYSSPRKDGPFIKVNCGAIPESLMDSELFGHEKGAFTGAFSQKRGRFERADGGTIFLDEIGELPPAAQVRLLRVLQNHEIERVGGTGPIPVNVRVISATNRNLEELVKKKEFREDLWFRLNVFPIMIPPLRHRKEDIPAMVHHFIERKSRELKIHSLPVIAPGAMDRLKAYHWPGNVRELENMVERALIQSRGGGKEAILSFDDSSSTSAPTEVVSPREPDDDFLPLDHAVREYIRHGLRRTDGRVEGKGGAAELLGLHPSTLRGKMRKLGIKIRKYKKSC